VLLLVRNLRSAVKVCSVTINVKETKQKGQGYKFKVFLYDLVTVTAVCGRYFVPVQCLL